MRRRTFLASATAAACPMVFGTRREPRAVDADDDTDVRNPRGRPQVAPRNARLRRRGLVYPRSARLPRDR